MFRFYSCVFRIAESKKETARAVMLSKYRIPYVFTIESSNGCYYDSETKSKVDFNKSKWEEMGSLFGVSLTEYILMVDEYEEFISLRREALSRKKIRRTNNFVAPCPASKVRLRETAFEEDKEEELLKPPPAIAGLFINMIEDIRNEEIIPKNEDS